MKRPPYLILWENIKLMLYGLSGKSEKLLFFEFHAVRERIDLVI